MNIVLLLALSALLYSWIASLSLNTTTAALSDGRVILFYVLIVLNCVTMFSLKIETLFCRQFFKRFGMFSLENCFKKRFFLNEEENPWKQLDGLEFQRSLKVPKSSGWWVDRNDFNWMTIFLSQSFLFYLRNVFISIVIATEWVRAEKSQLISWNSQLTTLNFYKASIYVNCRLRWHSMAGYSSFYNKRQGNEAFW